MPKTEKKGTRKFLRVRKKERLCGSLEEPRVAGRPIFKCRISSGLVGSLWESAPRATVRLATCVVSHLIFSGQSVATPHFVCERVELALRFFLFATP
ncbi:hypothetical protein L484_001401 [Morus notabilis]|uniref:Uncharacterized protein n=1 Tax=Morus notabilis TaxID=981085 RepID=W9QHS0_9ROSA|nr:hypothetical protein L484_001401 [Morus notabilis]